MPGAMEKWMGAASFIDGWLEQDETEQDRQLEYLESLAGVATRAEDIRGRQADDRRAEALFPGEQQQQKLTTTQMGITTQGMKRTAENTEALDGLIQEHYGLPSYEVFKSFVDAKATDVLDEFYQAQLASKVPQQKGELEGVQLGTQLRTEKEFAKGTAPEIAGRVREKGAIRDSIKLGSDIRTEKAFAAGGGPESIANVREQTSLLQEDKTAFEREVIGLRQEVGMPQLLVDTEKTLRELEPLGKRIDMVSALAQAKQRLGAAANTPLGKEQIMRDIFARKGLDYDAYRVREYLVNAGEMESKETLMDNIFDAEQTRLKLLGAEGDVDMGKAIMMFAMQQNKQLAKSMASEMGAKPTDVKQLLEPLNRYINANKALLWEYHELSYDRMSERQLVFTDDDLSEVIGGMLQDFPRFTDGNSDDIRNFLVNMINGLDPMHWDRSMSMHRGGLVQRWGQEDYFAAKQVLDTVQWTMGQEENPNLARPRAPYMGFPKQTITPLGAIQKSERQASIEKALPDNMDIEKLLGEGPLNLDSVEKELERLLQQNP